MTDSTQAVLIEMADGGVRARVYATTVDFGIVASTFTVDVSGPWKHTWKWVVLHSSKSKKDATRNVDGGSAGRIGCLSLLGEVLGEAEGSGFEGGEQTNTRPFIWGKE